jgi:glutamate 5-kinase
MSAGCATLIASGLELAPLLAVENGGPCTWFLPNKTPLAARKQWIAGTLATRGALTIDAGAERALNEGKSLLPVGVVAVDGRFSRGDAVSIKGSSGCELGRGLAAYDSDDAQVIRGQRSQDIERLLGYRGRDEMIHRDNLVLLDS